MLREMKAYAHLKPGQKGTLRLVEKYGASLLCVRYRYDEARGVRLKTVEIVVAESQSRKPLFNDDDLVQLSVAFEEKELRELLKNIRARWEPELKVWLAPYRLVRNTPLEHRIAAK
ncbi:MAG: hypothetical protein HGB26_00445 [Desulfobulbaceae bacterium]|nr:hypothetical protein [Desulfobulbaceae bacterium]